MVYCDQDMCDSKLGKFMQAFRADRPDEWQMDEFIRMAEDMNNEITRLRQAEKDAARYRCIRSIAKVIECEEFDMDMLDGQDLDAMVDECIEAMQCK